MFKSLGSIVWGGIKSAISYLDPSAYLERSVEVARAFLTRRSKSSMVMACVQWIMTTFPEAPVCLKRYDVKGKKELVFKHKVLALLRKPNPFYTLRLLWSATLMDYWLYGNAYWVKIRNQVGEVVQLWWVPFGKIEPISVSPDEFISYYQWGGKRLRPEDVVHFRFGMDPDKPFMGLSPLQSAGTEIFTDSQGGRWTASMLRNGAVPSVIVSPDTGQKMDKVKVRETKKYFKQRFSGDNIGEPMVSGTPVTVKVVSFNPRNMDLNGVRMSAETRVSALVKVPAVVVGLKAGLEKMTYANMEEAREAAFENNIIPTQNLFAEILDAQLLPDFEKGEDLWFAFDLREVRVLQDDQNALAERVGGLVQRGVITRATAQAELGYESTPADEVYLVPLSTQLIPSGWVAPEPPDPNEEPEEPEEPEDDEDEDGKGSKKLEDWRTSRFLWGGRSGHKTPRNMTQLQRRMLKLFDRIFNVLHKQMERDLTGIFAELGSKAAKRIAVILDDLGVLKRDKRGVWYKALLELTFAGFAAKTMSDSQSAAAYADAVEHFKLKFGTKLWEAQVSEQIMEDAFVRSFFDAAAKGMRRVGERHYLKVGQETFSAVEEMLGVAVKLPDYQARELLAEGGRRLGLVDLSNPAKQRLFTELTAGRTLGEGVPELVERIKVGLPAGPWKSPITRAMVIARTETKHAQRDSVLRAYKESGVVQKVLVIDNRVGFDDPDCTARDGETVTYDIAEQYMAAEHPQGTLDFLPIIS